VSAAVPDPGVFAARLLVRERLRRAATTGPLFQWGGPPAGPDWELLLVEAFEQTAIFTASDAAAWRRRIERLEGPDPGEFADPATRELARAWLARELDLLEHHDPGGDYRRLKMALRTFEALDVLSDRECGEYLERARAYDPVTIAEEHEQQGPSVGATRVRAVVAIDPENQAEGWRFTCAVVFDDCVMLLWTEPEADPAEEQHGWATMGADAPEEQIGVSDDLGTAYTELDSVANGGGGVLGRTCFTPAPPQGAQWLLLRIGDDTIRIPVPPDGST